MRWIRKRWAVFAACMSVYFFFAHAGINRLEFSIVLLSSAAIVFGSAFADRLSFDPSAIFIAKPWRLLQPSAGDTFRVLTLGVVTASLVLVAAIEGVLSFNMALFEGELIFSALFVTEVLRYRVAQVRWHGTLVDVRTRLGIRHSVRWGDLVSVRRDTFGDCIEFRDRAGRKFRINRFLRGYSEFVRDAERYCSSDVKTVLRAVK